ncbi:FHA domain-containing protein [Oxalobacteraceae bacterium OM1]|nr:FHA domain-containing protein [Oxalobacteraceae bacterium OM1]
MPSIILSKDGNVLREVRLVKERLTIGRAPHNDIVLEELAVSSEHAVIVTRDGDSFLEDLNSTNGTQVNGQPIRMHFLQHGDVVELAEYRIRYDADASADPSPRPLQGPKLIVLDGPNCGKEISLSRPIVTLGRPNDHIALVIREADQYYLSNVEGLDPPVVNGVPLGSQRHRLADRDVINYCGARLRVFLSN